MDKNRWFGLGWVVTFAVGSWRSNVGFGTLTCNYQNRSLLINCQSVPCSNIPLPRIFKFVKIIFLHDADEFHSGRRIAKKLCKLVWIIVKVNFTKWDYYVGLKHFHRHVIIHGIFIWWSPMSMWKFPRPSLLSPRHHHQVVTFRGSRCRLPPFTALLKNADASGASFTLLSFEGWVIV